ncbi:TRAP transporter large permease [Psychrobacillus sp. OK032]|uniref:TRAP transporter large permease n=1 Tax=Psychrobacillus sp. OK032 TaxID=1884358 RepID=UPI0008B4BF13|nr:TRAP transporter large permease [Psychrobacillus sp. OK032]SER82709.1 TRAP transporter, DctM subunit [Psychrobacillus sp. OK032]
MTVAIPLILLFVFLITGMPVAFSMAISGAVGLLIIGGLDLFLGIAQTAPYENAAVFLFTTVPMFIFMAELLTASNMTKDLFSASNKWLGHLPGGLGIATILAGAGLAAVSGSSTASAATLATSAVPEMKKYGYKTHFSMGVVSVAGTLAVMIPPSIALILYGILTETPIGPLLIAGIIPGLVTVVGYIVTILIWVKQKPEVAPSRAEKAPMKERLLSLKLIWPVIILMTAVIGGIYGGIVTATEAGALGAFATFVIALSLRRLKFKDTQNALKNTLRSTAMIMTIIIGAMFFGYYLISTQITQDLINIIVESGMSKWLVLAIVVILYLVLGLFMDQTAILILTLPFTFPLMMTFGFDPIWFGIIVVKTAEIGLITPPVGLNVFVASGAAKVNTSEGFKGVPRFVVAELIILLILILLPSIATWLPNLMG